MAGSLGSQRESVRDGAIEVYSPPSLSPFLPLLNPPKPKIPYPLLYRLPIVISEASLVAAFRRSTSSRSTDVSSAKPHPSLALLRVIIFRLSNNLFEKKEISALLDSVDKLGYREPLKELLSLKTISIEAACHNLITICYERADDELARHIRALYPDLELDLYSLAAQIICPAVEFKFYVSQANYHQNQRFKLFFGSLLSNASKIRLQQNLSHPNNNTNSLSCSLRLVLDHIRRYKARPYDIWSSRLLLLLCEEFLEDLGLFFEVWDPVRVPVDMVESLDPGSPYMPLATTTISTMEILSTAGFQHGKVLLLLRASIQKDHQLFQACLERFYPNWWLEGRRELLLFDIDSKGDFRDRRTQEILWEATMIINSFCSKDMCCQWLQEERQASMSPSLAKWWRDRAPELGRNANFIEISGHLPRTWLKGHVLSIGESYARLLIYIGMIREDLRDEVFELVWQRYIQMWPPVPSDEAKNCIREEYDCFLFSIITDAATKQAGRFSPALINVQNILDFKPPLRFLGEPSFHQKLSIIQKIINDVDDVNRQKIFAHFMRELFGIERPPVPASQDQLRLSELVRFLQETGLDLDFAVDHFVRGVSKTFKVEDVGWVTKKGSGNETYLDISFRKSSPWLFILLLSCGAHPRTLEDSFELGGRDEDRDEDRDEGRIPGAMWLAAESRDCDAISGLWSSRISPVRPGSGENGLKLAVKDVIATVSQGQLDKATRLIFRPAEAKDSATVKFFSLLGEALVSQLHLRPELFSPADTAVTKFLISSITSPAFASAVGEWCPEELKVSGPHDCERYCGRRRWIPKSTGINPLSVQYLFYQTCFEPVVLKSIQLGKVKVIAGLVEAPGVAHQLITWFPSSFRAYVSAAAEHSLEILKLLVAAGPSIEELCEQGLRPLHKAISSGQLNMIIYLLSEGARVEEGEYGLTAVEKAVSEGQLDTVALFLEVRPNCAELALRAA
ncbi:hypothetical protein TWF970_009478 [Orbilia oligospora]|uniref:Uncharacterized protein n=1 Tax=Orbilia oligospora TaxID=2813651 RepID=A0A7C8RG10_ORBOL|nr:hypothetical protein TWF970_009478 [Orbilia oligospora]